MLAATEEASSQVTRTSVRRQRYIHSHILAERRRLAPLEFQWHSQRVSAEHANSFAAQDRKHKSLDPSSTRIGSRCQCANPASRTAASAHLQRSMLCGVFDDPFLYRFWLSDSNESESMSL